jgi:hypothetical protein
MRITLVFHQRELADARIALAQLDPVFRKRASHPTSRWCQARFT